MSSGTGETSASQLKQPLELITKHCRKISVAKQKETSELADLCTSLNNCLSDGTLTAQQYNYNDLQSELAGVEKQLAIWSRYNYPKSLMKRKDIEAGVTGFLESITKISQCPVAQPTPAASGNHGVSPPDRKGTERSLPRGGAGDDSASVASSHNAGTFVKSQTAEPETVESQSAEANRPPPVKQLDQEVRKEGDMPFSGGPHCELWKGRWEKGSGEGNGGEQIGGEGVGGEKVILKALRLTKAPEKMREKLERALPGWAELRHQNILPFYGTIDSAQRLFMVFPWRENGNLLSYVKNKPQSDKILLLRGSASGLSYLHSKDIIHGSVKCNNVLVSQEGEPQICDFGIATIMEERGENTVSKTVSSAAVVRYAAPELIENNDFSATTHSDTYSFAMLILECITENVPFSNITRDAAVIHARISKRQCPPRPDGPEERNRVSDGLWDLMKRCWSVKPEIRPTMEHVQRFFLEQARE